MNQYQPRNRPYRKTSLIPAVLIWLLLLLAVLPTALMLANWQ